MAKISLRMYNREIESLIEQGQRLDEAIAHCRHILKTYPKHLETYRLLGKAYLEAKRYDQAVDIFQRVLVAAPEDFVSHVGMSIIADDKGKLDDAIWHMERAFEVQPSNAAIQGELQRLFGRRDGVEPPKIRLTRGALAHMYVQGELFTQAISEIRAVLSNDPKRTDMQTLLARAYTRNGQKAEATDICTELLGKYPYCLDANRLMAEIVAGTQKADTAQEYRQRVIELDPYAALVQDSLFRSDLVADNLVTLDRLEYTGEMAEAPGELGIGLETDSAFASRGPATAPRPTTGPGAAVPANLPEWLKGTADTSAAQAPAEPATPPTPSEQDIPDFLRQAGWGTASETASFESPTPLAQQPANEPAADAAIESDLPEWVKALAPTDQTTPPSQPTPAAPESDLVAPTTPGAGQVFAADTPDWLRELGEAEPSKPAPAPSAPAPSEAPTLPADAPDWLRDLGPATPGSAAPTPSAAVPSEAPALPADAPDWLRESGPAAPSGAVPAPAEMPEETPDWLKDLGGRELDEPVTPGKLESESDWLGDLRAEQPAMAAAETPLDESPDWLKEFSNDLETPITKPAAPATPEPAAEAPKAAAPEPPAPTPAAPEAVSGLGLLGTTAQEQDDAMAWLESLAAKHGAKPEELVTDPNARTDVAPEWVDKAKEISGQPAENAPVEDETGIWLRSLAAEAETSEAPSPAEEAVEEAAEEEPVDLRGGLEGQPAFTAAEPEPKRVEPPAVEQPETPEWLRGYGAKGIDRPSLRDAPDWLRGISEEAPEQQMQEAAAGTQAEIPTEAEPWAPEHEAAAPVEVPQPAETSDLPAWLAGLEDEELPITPSGPRATAPDELPAWLQAEVEPEPEAKEPANPADWHPAEPPAVEVAQPVSEPEPKPVEVQPPLPAEPKPAPAEVQQPVSEVKPQPVEEAPAPTPEPEPVHAEQAPTAAPEPQPAPVEKAPSPAPAVPLARPRPAGLAPKPAVLSLGDAQLQLGRGNITAALDIYGKLIRKGKSLEDIIRDLRDALYRYPVEVPLWQSLGDAYMRANRLQEALDAYTKAEELLR